MDGARRRPPPGGHPVVVAANLAGHWGRAKQPAELAGATLEAADRHEVETALRIGWEALEPLDDEALRGELPGPLGPMPGRAALSLALAELVLHRCDIDLALHGRAVVDDEVASAVLDVLPAWLAFAATGAPRPDRPLCFLLTSAAAGWAIDWDGDAWRTEGCRSGRTVRLAGAPLQLALVLSGGVPLAASEVVGDPPELLKIYLPGP